MAVVVFKKDNKVLADIFNEKEQLQQLLPPEYQQIQYLESTGTQYIKTSYYPSSYDLFTIDFYATSSTVQQRLFDNRISDGKKEIFEIYKNGIGNFAVNITTSGEINSQMSPAVPFNINTRYILQRVGISGTSSYIINGTSVGASSAQPASEIIYSEPLYLFASPMLVSLGGLHFSGRMYSFYVKDKINLVPCYRKSDGKPGMYDVINGIFYINQGTGTDFILGPSLLSNNEYAQVDYLISTGTQIINTGISSNQLENKFKVQLKILQTAKRNTTSYIFGSYTGGGRSLNISLNSSSYASAPSKFSFFGGNTSAIELFSLTNTADLNTWYDIDCKISTTNQVSINGITYTAATKKTSYSTKNFCIFSLGTETDSSINFKGYCALCRIFSDSGTICRDLIPCIRLSDGKPGMYDNVNNVFYTNVGTGEFTFGAPTGFGATATSSTFNIQKIITAGAIQVGSVVDNSILNIYEIQTLFI